MKKEIKLGNKVKDLVTGLTGIATSKTEHLNGCIQWGVTPPMTKDKVELPSWNIDEQQLEYVGEGITAKIRPVAKPVAAKPLPGGPTKRTVCQRIR